MPKPKATALRVPSDVYDRIKKMKRGAMLRNTDKLRVLIESWERITDSQRQSAIQNIESRELVNAK